MGCGSSKQVEEKEIEEIDIEGIDVPDIEPGYPPPEPPRDRKDSVFDAKTCVSLDDHAKMAPRNLNSAYSILIEYLIQPAKTDLEKLRVILVWLANQRISEMKYPNVKDAYSPDGYMKTIKQGNGSYASFFALLCRAAGLPCVVIRGYGKAVLYDVGDQDFSHLNSFWTAVYVSNSWRLVHPNWGVKGIVGFDLGIWTKVEESGQAVREAQQASVGRIVYSLQEYWFLTDPDRFVYFCLALKPEWQLLDSPWSVHKFANVPHFSQQYFDCGIQLSSEHASILKSVDGLREVTFTHPETMNVKLDYTLFFDEKRSQDQLPKDLQLDMYVIHSISENSKSLVIRFPCVGIYKIEVDAKTDSQNIHLCSFRLTCDGSLKNVQPYPLNPPIGYGFSSKAKNAGLTKPSQVKGIMIVKESEKVTFEFQRTEKVEVQALLVHKDTQSSELQSYIRQDDSNQNVKIVVTVPEHAQNPEYALQINTREQGSKGPYENVVNYLLTHDKKEVENKKINPVEDEKLIAEEKDLRSKLREATEGSDIESLEKFIREFQDLEFDDQGDLTRARQRLLELHEEALRKAINNRKLKGLERAVESAKASCVYSELSKTSTMKEAEDLWQLLKRVHLYLHKVLELKPATVSEIHSYKRPRPLVHNVMKATYLLLGESEKKVKVWEYVQNLLRKQGKQSIIRRIKEFDIIGLKQSSVKRAEEHLNSCFIEHVRKESAGAATFFVWSRNITDEVHRGSQST